MRYVRNFALLSARQGPSFARRYGRLALTAVEVPCLLVRVTLTPVIPLGLPPIVNGCAKVNWLPYCVDAASLNHVAKI